MLSSKKLTWKRPIFYLLLPAFFVMAFLGFPLPVAPPLETKARQEESVPVKKRKKPSVVLLDCIDADRQDVRKM